MKKIGFPSENISGVHVENSSKKTSQCAGERCQLGSHLSPV